MKAATICTLAASLMTACAARNYSPLQAYDLLNQGGRRIYFAADGELVRVTFGANSPLILIDTLNYPDAGKELRELPQQDPLRAKLEGNFDADLIIKADGTTFGDTREDEYSPINQVPRQGREITRSDKLSLSKYLNYIGTLLSSQSK